MQVIGRKMLLLGQVGKECAASRRFRSFLGGRNGVVLEGWSAVILSLQCVQEISQTDIMQVELAPIVGRETGPGSGRLGRRTGSSSGLLEGGSRTWRRRIRRLTLVQDGGLAIEGKLSPNAFVGDRESSPFGVR